LGRSRAHADGVTITRHGNPPRSVESRHHQIDCQDRRDRDLDHQRLHWGTGAARSRSRDRPPGRHHHALEDTLPARGNIAVIRDTRYVVDGRLVTGQAVSPGIDMALWLIARIHGRDHARAVRRTIQY
jgi:hypothetical protein